MRSNIVIVGLDYEQSKVVANSLSLALDMFFLDINDLIVYSLKNKDDIISKVGIDYYNKQIKKLVQGACDYENTVINVPYDLLLDSANSAYLQSTAKVVYLNMSKAQLANLNKKKNVTSKLDIQLIAYEEFSTQLKNLSDIVVNYDSNVDKVIDEIKAKIS